MTCRRNNQSLQNKKHGCEYSRNFLQSRFLMSEKVSKPCIIGRTKTANVEELQSSKKHVNDWPASSLQEEEKRKRRRDTRSCANNNATINHKICKRKKRRGIHSFFEVMGCALVVEAEVVIFCCSCCCFHLRFLHRWLHLQVWYPVLPVYTM
jgi:hypothetical protein